MYSQIGCMFSALYLSLFARCTTITTVTDFELNIGIKIWKMIEIESWKGHFSCLLSHTDSNFIEVFETRNKFLADSAASERKKRIFHPFRVFVSPKRDFQTSHVFKNTTNKLFRLSHEIHQKGIWPIKMKLHVKCLHVVLPDQTESSKISCRGKHDHHPIVLKVI